MFSLIILLLLKLSLRRTQLQHLIWMRLCYDSDEEENDSDITYVESTEIDNIVNNPLQHAIVQQGPSQQGPSHEGPTPSGTNKSEANPPWAKSAGANPSWANSAGAKGKAM